MRVENVKGAVWTVDDEEYYKRRPPRGVGASASPNTNQSPTLTPQTPSIIDQVSQNISIFTSTRISKGLNQVLEFGHLFYSKIDFIGIKTQIRYFDRD